LRAKKASYEELTDPLNDKINASLTNRAWAKLSIARARARYFDPDNDPYDLPNPMLELHHEVLELSGAIDGARRRDLVEVTKTNQAPENALSVNVQGAPNDNGNGNGNVMVSREKRGLL